ncbi:MAG: ribosome recycling factor [bacterium]|nr:ribosome recycling factor [bacterium]
MVYNFNPFTTSCDSSFEWLKKEYSGLRTGRSTPAILDAVMVEAYGSRVPVSQMANITIEDIKTIRVSPWDKTTIKSIDSAIRESNLGLSVSVDGEGVRVSFPELTSDRRMTLIKLSKQKLEEARISLRGEREKILSDLDKLEKEGEISKDDKFRLREELQKHVDDANRKLEEMAITKEQEISE